MPLELQLEVLSRIESSSRLIRAWSRLYSGCLSDELAHASLLEIVFLDLHGKIGDDVIL